MSTDFRISLDREVTNLNGALVSSFSPKTPDTEEFQWLSGAPQRSAVQEKPSAHEDPWIKVAPDFYVKKSEYQRRFGEVDLEYYRQRMSPRLFRAFVRNMGAVPGSLGLDVVELTTTPDF